MTHRMGRMTKRNRAKYRRRAYAAGMLDQPVPERRRLAEAPPLMVVAAPPAATRERDPRDPGDRRAA